MTWIYNVAMHLFTNSKTQQSYRALYAGSVGYKNDPSKECIKGHGPLPRGKYTMTKLITYEHTYKKKGVGHYAIELTPSIENHMCERGSFYIHGDDRKHPGQGSEGCIVAGLALRHTIWESGDRVLEVI